MTLVSRCAYSETVKAMDNGRAEQKDCWGKSNAIGIRSRLNPMTEQEVVVENLCTIVD